MQNQEKFHAIAILWIATDGTKLVPMLLFKSSSGG